MEQPHHVSNWNAATHKTLGACALRSFSRLTRQAPLLLLSLLLLGGGTLMAQQGFGTNRPNPQSVIHMEGVNQGLLIPDVSLSSATIFLGGVAATADHVSMLVYNTNTATTNGLSGAGYYYWSGTTWERLTTTAAAGGGGINLWDTDTDTGIQVEEGPDDDTVRFDTAGTERMIVGNTGTVAFGTNPGAIITTNQNAAATYTTIGSTSGATLAVNNIILATTSLAGSLADRTYTLPFTNTDTKGIVEATGAADLAGTNIKSSYWVYVGNNGGFLKAVRADFQLSGTDLQVRYADARYQNNVLIVDGTNRNAAFFETDPNWTTTGAVYQIASVNITSTTGTGVVNASIDATTGNAYFRGTLSDSNNEAGNSGEILTATGSGTDWVSNIPSTAITAGSDGQVLTTTGTTVGWQAVQGDNLGNHTATQDIALGRQGIVDGDGNTKIQVEEGDNDDTVRFDTAGTERMQISNTGNVGIGTNNPTKKLDIDLGAITAFSTGMRLKANAGGSMATTGLEIELDNSTSNASGFFRGARTANSVFVGMEAGTASRDGLRFLTGTTAATIAERMRINSAGNVGIGTNNPAHKLTVSGNAQVTGALYDSDGDAGSDGQLLSSTGSSTDWVGRNTMSVQEINNSSTTLSNGAGVVIVTNSSGAKITINLPTAGAANYPKGSILQILRGDTNALNSNNGIDISGSINGNSTATNALDVDYESVTLIAGTNTWLRLK